MQSSKVRFLSETLQYWIQLLMYNKKKICIVATDSLRGMLRKQNAPSEGGTASRRKHVKGKEGARKDRFSRGDELLEEI